MYYNILEKHVYFGRLSNKSTTNRLLLLCQKHFGCHLLLQLLLTKNKTLNSTISNLSQMTNFRLVQTERDNNFISDRNGRKFSIVIENSGKRRNCLLRAISPFPTVFSKHLYCRQVKTRACLGKG